MKQTFFYFVYGKMQLLPSLFCGITLASIISYLRLNTPSEIFGISVSLWLFAFFFNLWDIHTGIKAETVRQEKKGLKFVFKSGRGWRAIEKVVGFTVIIGFLHYCQLESIKYGYPEMLKEILQACKSIFFFYVVLIELQSIGENNEERYGGKSKLFQMLDNIIDVFNKGIIGGLKRTLKIDNQNTNVNEPNNGYIDESKDTKGDY